MSKPGALKDILDRPLRLARLAKELENPFLEGQRQLIKPRLLLSNLCNDMPEWRARRGRLGPTFLLFL
jgi:hypothetical protein